MARRTAESGGGATDRLKSELGGLVGALGDRAVASVRDRVEGATGRLTDYVEGGAGPGIMAAVTGAKGLAEGKSPVRAMFGAGMAGVKEKIAGLFGRRGKGGGSRKLKLINIVESLDVGVPVTVAYNQWTRYSDFPKFTKKVENVEANKNEETKTSWKAQVFWSHRTWEATVVEQVPDEMIVWRSKGQKGHVDGAVTFHELAPNLTRILLVLEYHPQGMFERTGNLWRAQGRRARLEFKHFRRYLMTEGILHADDLEGWRGTIHDGEVVESHEDAVAREEKENSQPPGSRRSRSRSDAEQDGGERAEREDRDENTSDSQAASAADTGNRRAATNRSAQSRTRRTSRTRGSDAENQSNGGRPRARAGVQRGGHT